MIMGDDEKAQRMAIREARRAAIRAAVLQAFPAAYKQADVKQMKTQIIWRDGRVLGVGSNGDAAWKDAYDNLTRGSVPTVAQGGSPTWSTKDDEIYWKEPPPASDV